MISVSNRENLELCKRYALAGFSDSINGVWTFCEINEGDFISFLYAARAHNLYKVEKKVAFHNALTLPPWKPITFKISRKTYYFPFRLYLSQLRKLEEPLIRAEFSYVAENLLLRGGYRKTHFQADQTTLQNVSQMGQKSLESVEPLEISSSTFVPQFSTSKSFLNAPYVFPFRELILQSAVRITSAKKTNYKNCWMTSRLTKLKQKTLKCSEKKPFQ